jgi:hypothetical protein
MLIEDCCVRFNNPQVAVCQTLFKKSREWFEIEKQSEWR